MEKRTIWVSGLVVLLVIGVVSVFAVSVQTDGDNQKAHSWGKNKHGMFGICYKCRFGFFNHSAKLDKFKEQLNISEDAAKEDVQEALQKWHEENKDLLFGHGMRGFHQWNR